MIKEMEGVLNRENVTVQLNDLANELYEKGRVGERVEKEFHYSLLEALYLMDKGNLKLDVSKEVFIKKASKFSKDFIIKYKVFKDLRERGYIVKTALKFGADFRVYDRGIKPGDDHAKWIVYPVHEAEALTWYDFSAKNRVAHSTKKKLLLGVVDDEGDISYWECNWVRP
jgi:tRNA-intron endonuclease